MKTSDLIQRLNHAAREAFESSSVEVEFRDGVLWLVRVGAPHDYPIGANRRSLAPVGLPKSGIRRLVAEIRTIAERY